MLQDILDETIQSEVDYVQGFRGSMKHESNDKMDNSDNMDKTEEVLSYQD